MTDGPTSDPAASADLSPAGSKGKDDDQGKGNRYFAWVRKLSGRTVGLAALGLVVIGVLMGFIVAGYSGEPPYGVRLLSLISEALVSTGLSTAILLFALYNRVEIDGAVSDAFKETCVPAVGESIAESTGSMETHVTQELNRSIESLDKRAAEAENALEERLTKVFAGTAPPVKILQKDQIYPHSIDLLRKLGEHSGGEIRILMSAEEDLGEDPSSDGGNQRNGHTGADGEKWLNELKKWLGPRQLGRILRRVVAIPRKGFGQQFDRAQNLLLKPLARKHATQWFLPDDDFSISVLLLGESYALFGFPEQRHESDPAASETPFQYAAVLEHRNLVRYLNGWFDERFADHSEASEVMHDGKINQPVLAELRDLDDDTEHPIQVN